MLLFVNYTIAHSIMNLYMHLEKKNVNNFYK